MEEKVYWEDLMENLAKEFGITVVVKSDKGIDIYKPGGDGCGYKWKKTK